MRDEALIQRTKAFVQQQLANAEGGHDWFHTQRVYNNAVRIAREEEVDLTVARLAALLHDIADSKFHDGDESIGPRLAGEFLEAQEVETSVREHVVQIIRHMSFKNSLETKSETFESPELFVVRDADRLDAIGAIGIARAFNFGGHKGRALYDPEIPPNPGMSKAAYKKSKGPTLNHFYEKLLLLKDRMHTRTARRLAEERHAYMVHFLEQFYSEWLGKR